MAIRTADADWNGDVINGEGHLKLESGAFAGAYSFNSRFGDDTKKTNPEELIAAAEAGCYTMALAGNLGRAGFEPKSIHTVSGVTIKKSGDGFHIPTISVETIAEVPDITDEEFQRIAEAAKVTCPVSQVLSGAEITLRAALKQ